MGKSECRPFCVLLSERQGVVIREEDRRGNKMECKRADISHMFS
jgi:hypothetical protein